MGERWVLLRGFKIVGAGSFGAMLSEMGNEYRKLHQEKRYFTTHRMTLHRRDSTLVQWLLEVNG
jgi:hypothetical protein